MKKRYFFRISGFILILGFLFLSSAGIAQNGNVYAISLDGAESFYVNDDASNHLDLTASYTFECWFNVDTYEALDRIFDRRTVCAMSIISANGSGDFALRFTERTSSHGILNTLETSATYDMNIDTWYHVAVTYDATSNDAKLYINGDLAASATSSNWSLTASTNPINIGGMYYSGYYYNQIAADIDEFRISNIARSISDMQTSTHREEYSSDANTVLLMHFNDQGDPPTYVSGTGLTGTRGDDDVDSFDYTAELISSPNYLLRPNYRSKATGNWNTPATWSFYNGSSWSNASLFPGDYNPEVNILGGFTVTKAGDLTITSNTTLTIEDDGNLTVSGTLTNDGTLTIQSNENGDGSLIFESGTPSATVQRYIIGHGGVAAQGWHQLGSPVATFNIDGSDFDPGDVAPATNDDLYRWEETTGYWMNYKNGDPTKIIPGAGYFTAWENDVTKEFSGILNVDDVDTTGLTNTPASGNSGWHLLGNPFASALKWNDGNWNLSADVNGTAKIWNSTGPSYTDINANGIIPSGNGFMVYVSADASLLTIPKASRVHNAAAWYKSTVNKLQLIARNLENNSFQEHNISLNQEATDGFDMPFDSYFLAGYAQNFIRWLTNKN